MRAGLCLEPAREFNQVTVTSLALDEWVLDIVLSENGGGLETIPRGPSIPLGPWDLELSVRVGEGKDPDPRTDRPRGWLHAPGHVLCLRSACQRSPL